MTPCTRGARKDRTKCTPGTPKPTAEQAREMRGVIMAALTVFSATAAFAETDNFDQDKPGSAPAGWSCGVTGRGNPRWAVDADGSAPSAPNALRQSGFGTFPWCVKQSASLTDG